MDILKRLVSSISAIVRSISASFGEWLKTVGNHRLATSIKSFCRRSTLSLSPPSSVQNSYPATPKINKKEIQNLGQESKCIVSFFTIIKCLNILWKLFSEIYFKIPSVFILKLEFPALHREWHKSGRSCICKWKMPQGLHLSFFHSFKVKINLTKKRIACCTCKWKMPLGPPPSCRVFFQSQDQVW